MILRTRDSPALEAVQGTLNLLIKSQLHMVYTMLLFSYDSRIINLPPS